MAKNSLNLKVHKYSRCFSSVCEAKRKAALLFVIGALELFPIKQGYGGEGAPAGAPTASRASSISSMAHPLKLA